MWQYELTKKTKKIYIYNADTTYIETDFFGNVSFVRSFIRQSFVRSADFSAIGKIAAPTSTEKNKPEHTFV